MKRECARESKSINMITGESLVVCARDKIISNLKIKKSNEEVMLDIVDRQSKKVFDIRIDPVTYISVAYPVDDSKYDPYWQGKSEPYAGVFGIYEKGISGFWGRILGWFKIFKRFF